MSVIPTILITFLTFVLLLRLVIFPVLFRALTNFRVSSFSPLSAYGLEWRSTSQANAASPTLRVQRARWAWGGYKGDDVGLVVLRLEGVMFRVRKGHQQKHDEEPPRKPKPSGRLAFCKSKIISSLLHLFIHHYPGLARIVSVHVSDIRLVFEELGGLELAVGDFRLGVKVDFEGFVVPDAPSAPAFSPTAEKRGNPLEDADLSFSPPPSPVIYTSFTHPFGGTLSPSPTTEKSNREWPEPMSRLSHARRRASHHYSKVSTTASQIWSRAIARAHGSVSFSASVDDVSIVVPREPDPKPARQRMSDLPNGKSQASSSPPSLGRLRSESLPARPKSFASAQSLNSIFRGLSGRSEPAPELGFDRLVWVEGMSRAVFGLGFGPKKGLLGEDTLKTTVELGKLQTSLGGVERIQELVKARAPTEREEQPRKKQWSPRAMPRIILRAFESVSVSLSHISISHHLPHPSRSHSASSSYTDLTAVTSPEEDCFTVSLELADLSCGLSAADSSNNEMARNAFGSNLSPECRVRGVAFALQWSSIALQCIAPGESSEEKSQLLAIRQADFNGLSTWRPAGWSREELLFAHDPNLAVVIGRGSIASVDVAGDVQLLQELSEAWKCSRPHPAAKSPTTRKPLSGLPPRIRMVLDVGHAMVLLADRVSEHQTTLTLASDGLHLGCFTSFSEVIARRRDRSANKAAFREEEKVFALRQQAGDEFDATQPESTLKPELRRCTIYPQAILQDDLSISMRADATLSLEPMFLHMSLSDSKGQQKTYHLASIGRAHGTVTGDVLGRQDVQADGSEIATLDPSTLSCSVDLGLDQGVKLNLWNMPVIDALVAMGQAHQHGRVAAATQTHAQASLLQRLPSGISARMSLGLISVFVGHEDPNPHCKLHLTRGIWLQSSATLEYAYFNNRSQAMTCRHALSAPQRAKLRLPEDITTQALAFFHHLLPDQGNAALVSVTLQDTFLKPIFNGTRFVAAGGTSMSHETVATPKERQGDQYVGWEFRRPLPKMFLKSGEFANNVPPLEISDTDQARRPLVRIPHAALNWLIQQAKPDAVLEHKLTSRVEHVTLVCDLSHVYSALLAMQTVKKVAAAWKKPKPGPESGAAPNLSIEVLIPHATAHFAFPLKEQAFFYFGGITASRLPGTRGVIGADQFLAYVPSAREIGSWEELGRIKRLEVKVSPPHEKLAFDIDAEALRLRIPVAYTFSKLVLNVNVTVKAIKLLLDDLGGKGFSFVRKPRPEAPKHIPSLNFSIKHMSLEAKDNPIETDLNLIWRAGLVEQEARNELEDKFEQKMALLAEAEGHSSDESVDGTRREPRLTHKSAVSADEARYRLDWWKSRSWVKRIRAAKTEQRRREEASLRVLKNTGADIRLPISIVQSTLTAPLFRAAFDGVKLSVSDAGMSRDELLQYMGDVSAPFDEGTEFSLMVPLKLSWSMDQAVLRLRDYPLPLLRVPPVQPGETRPAWHVETPFIIAEELQGDDSMILIPTEVIPAGCGAADAAPFTVQIAKTIMPVKTYARPMVRISSDRITEFTWGNSYQPAIQDFMKVIESLSHPPRDPSARVGFWDKFRLILHWRVTVDFFGPCHLHLKGSRDPYAVNGLGAGFALAWRNGTRLTIAQPNPQYETIQIASDELLIAIPDLTSLHDGAAIGSEGPGETAPVDPSEREQVEQGLISRRYTKPCARFLNGVRVGFGFVFERTCRPWTCEHNCGETDNLFHRQCRIFDFKPHQQVILRAPEAIERAEQELGHTSDSYEGFRSDYIHFSVSLVAPTSEQEKSAEQSTVDADKHNSLHFSPKAFAHFFAWWNLFDSSLSLPIRQGKLFPDSPPPSKKFGKSLGTIKYRFDLAPVYVSHVYAQVAPELWAAGKSQSLGVKFRFKRFRADAHQRAQEKVVRHEKLGRTTVVVHKPFYAADLLLNDITLKGMRADFSETTSTVEEAQESLPRASELAREDRAWFNYFDFVDADRKPFDQDPRIELVDIGDCPAVFYSKRVKARQSTPNDDDGSSLGSGSDSRLDVESSKFGHEKSHICYLGAAEGVGPTQIRITEQRIEELEARLNSIPEDCSGVERVDKNVTTNRLRTLHKHLGELSSKEKRHIDDHTLESADGSKKKADEDDGPDEVFFENTFHVHCPRVFFTNTSRNILYKYFYSSQDRKREEYTTSHASLRGIRDGMQRRLKMIVDRLPDDGNEAAGSAPADTSFDMLRDLERFLRDKNVTNRFRLPADPDSGRDDLSRPSAGLPADTSVKPKNRLLILKPQIALRSQIDDSSIVLLAVEEVSFKGFAILDEAGLDAVSADVLTRDYVFLKGMQAFYPTEETMCRERGPQGVPRGLDFVPLEIFLDVRSEATDYDRIVLKTDAALSFDRFNHLRLPRGLQWPEVDEDNGTDTSHLRIHQDLTTIVVPRVTVSATSKHYTALYNVVTDLLLYQDPSHRHRSERVDSFIFAFDRKDRDPVRLLMDLFNLQQSIRSLAALQRGYEANVDLLTDEGKSELFKIRTDLLEATEQLFTVFEAISINTKRDEARAALITTSRMDVRAGGIAWHMLQDDFKPLIKLDIDGMLYSHLTNKDGSTDSAMVISDLCALNSNADALYPEVMVRYDSSGSARKKSAESFASASWSMLAPVGGIAIVRHFAFYLHPVRFKLEERVGHAIVDYIFNDRVKRRKERKDVENGTATPRSETNGNGMAHLSTDFGRGKNPSSAEMPPLARTRSTSSVATQPGEGISNAKKFAMVPMQDAAEMRLRAKSNKTFIRVVFGCTSFVLSYKTDDSRKHSTFSMPDCVDFKLKTPEMVYQNKVWGYEDVFEHVKRDIRSYAWSQTGDLLSQIIKKTSVFRSKKGLRQLATSSTDVIRTNTKNLASSPSRLRYHVEPPTPGDDEQVVELGLARAISRVSTRVAVSVASTNGDSSSPVSHIRSKGRESSPSLSLSPSPEQAKREKDKDKGEARGQDEENSGSDDEKGVGKAVKGFLGKLRTRHASGAKDSGDEASMASEKAKKQHSL